jgi:hypothetical protein
MEKPKDEKTLRRLGFFLNLNLTNVGHSGFCIFLNIVTAYRVAPKIWFQSETNMVYPVDEDHFSLLCEKKPKLANLTFLTLDSSRKRSNLQFSQVLILKLHTIKKIKLILQNIHFYTKEFQCCFSFKGKKFCFGFIQFEILMDTL